MSSALIDGFGRKIDYVRMSVTDRCDFRCIYCMAEDMTFLPRQQILCIVDDLAFRMNITTTREEVLDMLHIIQQFDQIGRASCRERV